MSHLCKVPAAPSAPDPRSVGSLHWVMLSAHPAIYETDHTVNSSSVPRVARGSLWVAGIKKRHHRGVCRRPNLKELIAQWLLTLTSCLTHTRSFKNPTSNPRGSGGRGWDSALEPICLSNDPQVIHTCSQDGKPPL